MARMLDPFEEKLKAEEMSMDAKAENRRKKNFIKKWVTATPQQQAEILWELFEEKADRMHEHANSDMRLALARLRTRYR